MALFDKLKNIKKKKNSEKKAALRQKYLEYRLEPLDENSIILEARNGKEIDGNVYYILKELLTNPEYSHFKLAVSTESEEKAAVIRRKVAHIREDHNVDFLMVGSEEYYKAMATAGFIVCDATLQNFFIKREGQVYLNLWHGTPFKVMGRRVIHEPHAVGNAQKNFAIADYLLYPNEYMMNHMIEDYMIGNISEGKALLAGYPRNSAFFDDASRQEIIQAEGLDGKKIYVYMPTYRPTLMGSEVERVLAEMDKLLEEDELLFAKIHPLAAETVDYSAYDNIRAFPGVYETYEFLNVADVLITDYSSVFYDFAATGRKIVLYTYDEEDYLSTRGLYEPIEMLPFVQVKSVEEVMAEARSPKAYDDTDFIRKYCAYEGPNAAALICKLVFAKASYADPDFTDKLKLIDIESNGKDNILIFVHDLNPGQTTDALLEYLGKLNPEEANYFVTFKRGDVEEHAEMLFKLPEGIDYFGRAGKALGRDVLDATGDLEDFNGCLDRYRCFGNMKVSKIVCM